MTVYLNGEPRELPAGASVADAVLAAGAPPLGRGIAVAIDGQVVPRSQWNATEVADGQRIEVVEAVQGG